MRDLLTESECDDLLIPFDRRDLILALQCAARLGAERAREQCAKVCEKKVQRRPRQWDDTAEDVRASWSTRTGEECAAAIRRGEEIGVVADSVDRAIEAAQSAYPDQRIESVNDCGAVDLIVDVPGRAS